MAKVEEAEADQLGVKLSGSPQRGQKVELAWKNALGKIFGTSDDMQAEVLLSHCLKPLKADEASDDHPGNDERIFMLSIIRDMAPRDAIERMLAVQMAATHVATIRSSRWLAHAETIPQVQAHYTGFNKLARTFTAQVEALRKYRTGGKQTVVVQRMDVSDGGQAIVGNVQHGGRASDEG
ncbi:hypothetical protein FLO80_02270 [Aquicoccus porphyridii]|uniref:Uncharacterized protein n=1 Tax=Aquicoccus porphyridii TaxID=1852029 RepID=A0A5A9ZUG6_9RHOB|nr:hypothetical protein [Aquicoccus porphyridii]KAA0921018.1 hypothetical protein FLO80_02270 [Aquicoccus porphyridii]RAI56445.1 hypothetical protein DOO74_00810 [Rhodobacteraceae bacterium AsT-22]